jgi:hypothetical protein
MYLFYILIWVKAVSCNNNLLTRRMLRRRELFEGGAEALLTATLHKDHRDLPVFSDELNDALEAHDTEEYGRIVGAMPALLARSR